jgi:hypothetical protein
MTVEFSNERAIAQAPLDSTFARQQQMLARFNRSRLTPGFGEPLFTATTERRMRSVEGEFLSQCRHEIAPLLANAPDKAHAFVAWFESMADWGPGQKDPLFPWLAEEASLEEMRWFLHQEVAGEAGFEDVLALAQVKMPVRPKLEMARNFWDEMGRGQAKGMHGPMLERLALHLELTPDIDNVVPESLALGNVMMALAANRAFAFHAIGALGVIEMTAPDRAAAVTEGLKRLGVSPKVRHYFALHAVLDRRHSADWNAEVIVPLIGEDPRRAVCIAEGALLRLARGKACFDAYRAHLGLTASLSRPDPEMNRSWWRDEQT